VIRTPPNLNKLQGVAITLVVDCSYYFHQFWPVLKPVFILLSY